MVRTFLKLQSRTHQPAVIGNFGNLLFQAWAQRTLGNCPGGHLLKLDMLNHPVYVVRVIVELIKLIVIADPHQQQNGTGHAYGKSENVNDRDSFGFPYVPEDKFESDTQHGINIFGFW